MASSPAKGAANIPELALRGAEQFGDRPAVVDGAVHLDFADVRDAMLAVASSLIADGIQPGDRVALWAPNSAAWITTALGTLATGALLVPLNTRFTAREAAYILDVVDAARLFVTDGFLGRDYVGELETVAPRLRALADPVSIPGPGVSTTDA